MKDLGIIGGLGPLATAYCLELITRMTEAASDQEHIRVIIDSNPSTPDRTGFLLGKQSEDPYPFLLKGGENVRSLGADIIAIPCNTAHAFCERLSDDLGLPIIHMIRETAGYLKNAGVSSAGLMATAGTIQTQLYQRALEDVGITPVIPEPQETEQVMHIIYQDVKANRPAEMNRFFRVSDGLKKRGAQVIIMGCTELSVIKRDNYPGEGFIDALEVLSAAAVKACGAPLAEAYSQLITKA